MRTAILAGATGLIGSQVLEILLQESAYTQVITLSRKPLTSTHPKLLNIVVDFEKLPEFQSRLKGEDIYCCLGTTMRQAGSKEAFRKVDFEYPVSLARITHRAGAVKFLVITALGANKNSSVFYNRVKGEAEEEIKQVGFRSLHIFQPSLLLGKRAEKRTGEGGGKAVMTALDFLIPKKYKAIDSAKVARAMVAYALNDGQGAMIHVSSELQDF